MARLTRVARRVFRFFHLLVSRFVADRGLPNAASLSYTTLLSLVPLMTVSLALFSAFPVSELVVSEIHTFVFQNFVPASSEVVQRYLLEFSSKASRLSGIGVGVLVVVAVMMMINIDQAINVIWRAKPRRTPLAQFLMYWSVLTLGPLFMGLSVVVTSYLVSMPIISDTAQTLGLKGRLLSVMPVLAAVIGFSLLYAVVPNRKVPLRHAIAGGLFAATLFEIAKRGFAFYVTSFPTYQAIYGALAVVPIFLVWIYLSWVITLLGAEFAYCLGIFRDQGRHGISGKGGDLLLTYHLFHELWKAQQVGGAISIERLAKPLGFVAEERLELLLNELQRADMLICTSSGKWALSRDLSRTSLHDLYRARGFVLPAASVLEGAQDDSDQALASLLRQIDQDLESTMDVPLAVLFSGQAVKP